MKTAFSVIGGLVIFAFPCFILHKVGCFQCTSFWCRNLCCLIYRTASRQSPVPRSISVRPNRLSMEKVAFHNVPQSPTSSFIELTPLEKCTYCTESVVGPCTEESMTDGRVVQKHASIEAGRPCAARRISLIPRTSATTLSAPEMIIAMTSRLGASRPPLYSYNSKRVQN